MFGRKHYQGRRSANPLFMFFRLILSLTIFLVLLGGVYSAYRHFSGIDPLKLDPQALLRSALEAKTPQQLMAVLSSLKVNKFDNKLLNQANLGNFTKSVPATQAAVFKFLLVTDSHNDNANLRQAISQAKQAYPNLSFIIGLGDYTDVGTLDELQAAKKEFDLAGLRYFLLAGDHDLWDSRNRNLPSDTDFKQVFGPTYQSFIHQGFLLLLLDNSDNYQGFGSAQLDWLGKELEKGKQEQTKGMLVFMTEPLYHPSSDHYMGKVEKNLKQQAQSMIFLLRAAGVKKIFAWDTHYFSEYEEPQTKLPMMTVGAIVADRNPQVPRYAIVTVYEDGSTRVDDVEIK